MTNHLIRDFIPIVSDATYTVTIVVPVFNEEDVLPVFHRRLVSALADVRESWEVLFVDDGSDDNTFEIIKQIHARHGNVGVAKLSRNFGKEAAMSAGLQLATGRTVVVIDVDLQDPPELIPSMLAAWKEGADVVNMRRCQRAGESWFKLATAHAFYRIINRIAEVPIPENVGDFRLLSRRAVDALNQLPENSRFMKGLFAWVGYRQRTLDYDREPRAAGQSKWPYWKLWNFALEGITGFSTAPLKLASYAGLASALGAFVYGLYFLFKTMLIGDEVRGFPTLILTICLLGGLQLMATGILGEYLGRMFLETKRRPLFLLDNYEPAALPHSLGEADDVRQER